MYPFKPGQSLLKNRWYVAAFSEEITRQPMERTILGTPVVFYRTEDGTPIAMYGLCPHRYFPLALGKLEGDAIVCGYHGFTFAADGKCIKIPAQGTGSGFRLPVFTLVERGPLVWIWMGDRERCDNDQIPPYEDFGLDQPGWNECAHTRFQVDARAQLLIDNLMDLTHLPFLHMQVPVGEAFLQKTLVSEQRPRSFQLRRPSRTPWSGFHEMLYTAQARFEGLSDMESITDFYGPELIRTSGPITKAIDGHNDVPKELGTLWILHGITPESDQSMHYFGLMTRDFRIEDTELDDILLKTTTGVRQQDVDAVEAVEVRLNEAVDRQAELLVRSDAPAVHVRKQIQAMFDAENV